jgi:hypothetical protein
MQQLLGYTRRGLDAIRFGCGTLRTRGISPEAKTRIIYHRGVVLLATVGYRVAVSGPLTLQPNGKYARSKNEFALAP